MTGLQVAFWAVLAVGIGVYLVGAYRAGRIEAEYRSGREALLSGEKLNIRWSRAKRDGWADAWVEETRKVAIQSVTNPPYRYEEAR